MMTTIQFEGPPPWAVRCDLEPGKVGALVEADFGAGWSKTGWQFGGIGGAGWLTALGMCIGALRAFNFAQQRG